VYSDLEQALARKPDVAFITNRAACTCRLRCRPLARLHLFIEKPLSHSLEQVSELTRLCEEQKLTTCVAYQLRYHPGFQRLRELLGAGVLGQLLSVRAEVWEYLPGFHPYEDYRRMYASKSTLGGGVTLSQIHEIDYLCALFGTPRRVFSMGGRSLRWRSTSMTWRCPCWSFRAAAAARCSSSCIKISGSGRPSAVAP